MFKSLFLRKSIQQNNGKQADVLIVSTVEPFEDLDKDTSPWRSGKIYKFLTQNQINAKVITSSFNHYTKSFRSNHTDDSYILMRSIRYRTNISIFRFINYCLHVPQLVILIVRYRPKIVLITIPPVVHLLSIFIVKIVDPKIQFWIDIRDLWPEIFTEKFSKFLTKTGSNTLFAASFKLRDASLVSADYVTTISPIFSDILANDKPSLVDKIKWFPHPKAVVKIEPDKHIDKSEKIKFVYVGSLSLRTDLVNFVRNVASFIGKDKCEFIIGGLGVLGNSINDLKLEGIELVYLGWVPGVEVNSILKQADFGIIPYPATIDFDSSFPNKYLEYCALGMRSVSRPLSIYSHDDVPVAIRPFTLNEEFRDLSRTKLSIEEQQSRQQIFEKTLSEVKMREYLSHLVVELAKK